MAGRSLTDPATIETWRADGADGEYLVKITESRGTFTVVATRNKGSGHRRVFRETTHRRPEAERLRRKLLLALVADGRC